MLIDKPLLDLAFRGFKTIYSDANLAAPSEFEKIAMPVQSLGPSGSRDETYGWIGNLPAMREWIGSRVIGNLSAYGFTITNRKFELTVSVGREDIEDDRLGTFKPAFAEMGNMARRHPDEMVFNLLKTGFTSLCFDGQNFFDTDHPVIGDDGVTTATVANTDGGAGSPWFLLDVSRAVRPIIWQTRVGYEFQQLTDDSDEEVLFNDRYIYGVRARVNAGVSPVATGLGVEADAGCRQLGIAPCRARSFPPARFQSPPPEVRALCGVPRGRADRPVPLGLGRGQALPCRRSQGPQRG